MSINDKIIVALDVQSREELDKIIKELEGSATYVKVGMELYYTFGASIIKELKDKGFKVFLDLKIHDIPNTAKSTAKTITSLGANIINVHAAGGIEMMKAAMSGVKEALEEDENLSRPLVIAVTQLTSTSQETLNYELLIPGPMENAVFQYAMNAKLAGLDGVVSSPLEVDLIKQINGPKFLCITPGIRPSGVNSDDQKRVTTPNEALKNGSDFLVIGRAITNAESPKQAYNNIIEGLK
jgi:orotidine-5'-phosphate decarboxylase